MPWTEFDCLECADCGQVGAPSMNQPFIPTAEQLKAALKMAARLDMISENRADSHCKAIDQQCEIATTPDYG